MKASPLSAAFIVATVWTILPWFDDLQSHDFQFNYVVPSVVLLIMIYIYPTVSTGRQHRILLFVLAVVCTWLHEGFGCVGAIYFMVAGIMQRNIRTMVITVSGLAVGLGINMLLGTATRVSDTTTPCYFDVQTGIRLAIQIWPYALSIAALALAALLCSKEARITLFKQTGPLMAGATAGILMAVAMWRAERVLWCADLFCVRVICILADLALRRAGNRIQIIAGSIFILAYSWWISELCVWEKRIGDDIRRIETIHGAPGNGAPTVYSCLHSGSPKAIFLRQAAC